MTENNQSEYPPHQMPFPYEVSNTAVLPMMSKAYVVDDPQLVKPLLPLLKLQSLRSELLPAKTTALS